MDALLTELLVVGDSCVDQTNAAEHSEDVQHGEASGYEHGGRCSKEGGQRLAHSAPRLSGKLSLPSAHSSYLSDELALPSTHCEIPQRLGREGRRTSERETLRSSRLARPQ